MSQLKLVTFIIDEGDPDVDIGPGTHGAACADIIHTYGEAIGTVVKDVWRPEINCQGDCGGCNTAYDRRMAKLKSK